MLFLFLINWDLSLGRAIRESPVSPINQNLKVNIQSFPTIRTNTVLYKPVPISKTNIRAYSGEIQIKLIQRGDCFYDITKIKDITNGTAGQALIKTAGSVYNVSKNSIPPKTDLSIVSTKKLPMAKHREN